MSRESSREDALPVRGSSMHFGEHGESGETSSAHVKEARKSRYVDMRMVDSKVLVI